MVVTTILVDTLDACREYCRDLMQELEVAVDIEGIALSRIGRLCLI